VKLIASIRRESRDGGEWVLLIQKDKGTVRHWNSFH